MYLAARLWPDVPDASARASLRTAIWAVRQAWGAAAEQVLECSRNSIGMRDGALWVDALDAAPGEETPAGLEAAELLAGIDEVELLEQFVRAPPGVILKTVP